MPKAIIYKYPTLLMFLIITIIGLFNLFFGEIIPAGNGLGFDGQVYGDITRNFSLPYLKNLDGYRAKRIVPSLIVGYMLRLFKLSLQDEYIIMGFQIYNLLLLLVSIYSYNLIADELRLKMAGRWLGFIGLFINFAILKFAFYYPVLTDTTAFTIGIMMLYCFLKNKPIGMLIVSVIGFFTWPTTFYFGILLYCFPRDNTEPDPTASKLKILLGFLTSTVIFSKIIDSYFIHKLYWVSPIIHSVVYLSVVIVLVYIFICMKTILNYAVLFNVKYLMGRIRIQRLAVVLFIFFFIKIGLTALSITQDSFSRSTFYNQITLLSIAKPFIFSIAHIAYFGPLLILFFLYWPSFCKTIHRYGIGLTIFIALSIILSINSVSRQLIDFVPVFIIFLVKAIDEQLELKFSHIGFMVLISLFYSKIWFRINKGLVFSGDGNYLDFPPQRYFMNFGEWMSNAVYIIQFFIVLCTGILFYCYIKRHKAYRQHIDKENITINPRTTRFFSDSDPK